MNKLPIILKVSGLLFTWMFATNRVSSVSPRESGDNQPDADRPNIVSIMADDLGFSDLGCYGGEARTPHLDQLSKQGVRFNRFHNSGKSEPPRAALMTGHRNTMQIGYQVACNLAASLSSPEILLQHG